MTWVAAAPLSKHLVLTHFQPTAERDDVRAIVSVHYSDPSSLAENGHTFEIEER